MAIDPRTDKLIRRTTMVGTVTAAYFLLSADYGLQDYALRPFQIKRAIESAKSSLKKYVFGSARTQECEKENSKDQSSK
ncbi:hypothetical protein Cni_G22089 [Canna indica]|uniref:Uncharacterized protein n=1 Tax=Canna indica TaxID=4628 RepID=A0AAQ3QJ99_9LILI|nr:hypothetical protein Cni_G22089 [Canna indica]